MKINNKFGFGEKVYFPGADLDKINSGKIEKIIISEDDSISFATDSAYGVKESDCFKTNKEAKERLLEMMEEKQDNINEQIDKAIEKVSNTKPKDLEDKVNLDS